MMLHIENVWKSYAHHHAAAVKGVSLDVQKGELLTLVGESGSGKTTLLRLIAGLETPERGSITVDGTRVVSESSWVPPEKRNIGMVFQGGALFPHLTVEKNIAYGLANLSREEQVQLVEEHLQLVQMPAVKKRYPHELSGGERQRIALARALAPKPKMILLDEPFSNLDTALKTTLRKQVCAILESKKMTAVLVTHDPRDAQYFGDHIAIMRAGVIEQYGPTKTVVNQPSNDYCAQLIGCR